MRHLFATLLGILLCAAGTPAESLPNGTIVEQTACEEEPAMTYEQYVRVETRRHTFEVEAARLAGLEMTSPLVLLSPEARSRQNDASQVDCQRIKYMSDGLKVAGFLWKPKDTAGKKLPVLLFNRGGNRDFGKLTPWEGLHRFAASGFVVIASQYRGNDGGEGREELGGADVRDVLNLIPLAASLEYADLRNVFLYGVSRGGMMTYLALKNGIAVNAA
ncbi:MAG: CocE/NonD family hydrolase, partial [Acidobacteriota bacterium]